MMNHLPLDHVAIAVRSLDEALPMWEAIIGGESYGREAVPDQGVDVAFVGKGDGRVELIAPIGPGSPVNRFLERRGPGLHHLCYRVPDIRAAIERFAAAGFQPIDSEPRRGAHGHLAAFFDPRSTGGVLIELVERAAEPSPDA